jgi:hypothetical protein
MHKFIKIIQDTDSDRVIILHKDVSRWKEYADGIIGINFHQGDYNIDLTPQFMGINPHITEIYRRLTLNYPNLDYMFLVDKAIELYCDAFVHQKIDAVNFFDFKSRD